MSNPKKIIIAEDSSVIQNITKRILTAQNFEIRSVKNGQQVLDLLEKEKIDLILMDINMPVMNGIDCTREIREMKDPEKSDIPIIAITGNAMNLSEEEYRDIGINDLLQKPLNFDQLVNLVRKHIDD